MPEATCSQGRQKLLFLQEGLKQMLLQVLQYDSLLTAINSLGRDLLSVASCAGDYRDCTGGIEPRLKANARDM